MARRLLAASLASLAIVTLLTSCDTLTTPSRPTPVSSQVFAITSSSFSTPSSVPWHCLIESGPWHSSDCRTPARPALSLGVAALAAPGTPANLTASVTGNRVSLAWLGPAGGDQPSAYVVEAGSSSGRADLANFDTGSATPALVADSVPSGIYYVRVRAKNAAGVSGPSNEVLVPVSACSAAPAAPTTLSAVTSGSRVTISWGASAGVTSYLVEAGSAAGLSNLAASDTGDTATSLTATVGSGTYYVRVKARNACGTSGPSNEVNFTISSCTAPPVVNPWPTGDFFLGWSSAGLVGAVQFNWSGIPIGPVSSYVLELGTTVGGTDVGIADVGLVTSYRVTGLRPSVDYYHARIRAKNSCGVSGPSNEANPRVN